MPDHGKRRGIVKLIGAIALVGLFLLIWVNWVAGLLVLILAQLMVMGRRDSGETGHRWARPEDQVPPSP